MKKNNNFHLSVRLQKWQHLLLDEVRVAIKFATMLQAPGPGKYASDGVGAGRPSLEGEVRIMFLSATQTGTLFLLIMNAKHHLFTWSKH